MKAMILAAGKGTRMLPLTLDKPKPLLEVADKTLIQHQIEKLASSGVREIVINHSYLGEMIEQALGTGSELGVSIEYSSEPELLETAGGIIQALPLLEGNASKAALDESSFIVVNADVWTDYPFHHLPVLNGDGCLAHLVMVANAPHHPQGDFVLKANGLLSRFQNPQEEKLTYSGIGVFHPSFFSGIRRGKLALSPLLKVAIDNGQVSGEYFQGEWVDVGTPQRLEELQLNQSELQLK